jgi:hypothetical protein
VVRLGFDLEGVGRRARLVFAKAPSFFEVVTRTSLEINAGGRSDFQVRIAEGKEIE